ncbi:MAG TPA: hypothetical protein ENO13_01315 [Candidatus Bathyarchaeota archaeon]|nr:hypothetical protein [Candidatus Bathyarchaeota archaeon]
MTIMKSVSDFFITLFGTSQAEKELRKQFESTLQHKRERASNLALAKEALEEAQRKIHIRTNELEGNVKRESVNG